MKSLRLREMLLLSPIERSGRRIRFDPRLTVIQGPNDTGKSSIIKSIFSTFGAAPPKIHPRWKNANVSSLVHFSVDERNYSILRLSERYGVFDADGRLIGAFSKVTSDLGPFLADLFDFRLQLPKRDSGTPETPPPAFFFLPFYIDQDDGWVKNWASLGGLHQYKNARKDVIEYHVGIKPNEYYTRKAKVREAEAKKQRPLAREQVLLELKKDLRSRFEEVKFDIDVNAFKDEIDRLLDRAQKLKEKEDAYRRRILQLRAARDELMAQRSIVNHARHELRSDYEFAAGELDDDEISCPTCGANYINGVAERFDIARDEQRCIDLLAELAKNIDAIEGDIKAEQERLSASSLELREVEDLLAVRKGQITFQEMIENEGRKGFQRALDGDIVKVTREIADLDGAIRDLQGQMKKIADPKRRSDVNSEYNKYMERFSSALGVHNISRKILTEVDAVVQETGSDLPRALLAYSFSVWHVMRARCSSAYAPLVIDAINQQEQDKTNLEKILHTIRDDRPEGSQTIVGLVDAQGISFEASYVKMERKYSALLTEEHASISNDMRPFMDRLLRS